MTSAFQRQANRLLADGGYEFVQTNSSAHEVWRKSGVPDIHVPGSPSGGRDSMLLRVTRAIRKGTALTPPSGQETDMPAAKKTGPPLSAQMVELASKQMLRDAEERVAARERGEPFRRPAGAGFMEEEAKWITRCLNTFGRISGADLNEAGEALQITQPDMSVAKKKARAASYRVTGTPRSETWVDFTKNLPPDAILFGGRKMGTKNKTKETATQALDKILEPAPAVAAHPEERSRPAALGSVEADFHNRVSPADADAHSVVNGARSQLDAALELLREAALADTHAITPGDIMLLQGHRDTMLRTADDMRGMAASIGAILARVQEGLTVENLV